MSRVLFFPSSSSRASFSIARARLFALAIFFHPLFLFSLRFKVVIFSRPLFFQPVLRFVSLLIFFFGRSCAFVFEVQGLPPLLEYFLPISSSCTRIFFDLILSSHFPFICSISLQTFLPRSSFFSLSFLFFLPFTFTYFLVQKNFTSFFFLKYFFFSFLFFWHNLCIQLICNFIILFLFLCYKFYVYIFSFLFLSYFSNEFGLLFVFHFRPFFPPKIFVSLILSCYLTFTSTFFSAFPLSSVVPSRLRNHI